MRRGLCAGLLAASVWSAPALGKTSGMIGYTGQPLAAKPGALCTSCHLGGANPVVTIDGPEVAAADSVASYTLVIKGGAAVIGGFAVSTNAPDAELLPSDDTRVENGELTHKFPGTFQNGKLSYTFSLHLPKVAQELTIFAVGNSCNADGAPSGDAPGAIRMDVTVSPPESGGPDGTEHAPGFVGYTGGCQAVPGEALWLCSLWGAWAWGRRGRRPRGQRASSR